MNTKSIYTGATGSSVSPGSPSVVDRLKAWANNYFCIAERGSSIDTELVAGVTTFLAMVYSVIVIPGMLSAAGFDHGAVYIATCLVAGVGSLLMGWWANLPIAIGCAISITAFLAFSLVIGQGVSIPVALGAVVVMGVVFSGITLLGVREWILNNLPAGIGHGTSVGIGLFLLLIAANGVDLVIKNPHDGLPVMLGDFTSMPVLMSVIGLGLMFGVERRGIPGGILLVILGISAVGIAFDPAIEYHGIFAMPSFSDADTLIGDFDIMGALNIAILPCIFALVLTSVFDATATIRAVADQAKLLDERGRIQEGGKALSADSLSSVFAGMVGGSPAAVYIESAAGTAAGGKTGLTAVTVGVLFLLMLFLAPLSSLVPAYATSPALMYVGLLMLRNVAKINFSDSVDAMSGLTCAVFIVLTGNIVTGIMLGYLTLLVGRVIAGEGKKLNAGTVITGLVLAAFYCSDFAI